MIKTNTLVMLGGLLEMVIWSISREYLEAFVWNNVLILVGIASSGLLTLSSGFLI